MSKSFRARQRCQKSLPPRQKSQKDVKKNNSFELCRSQKRCEFALGTDRRTLLISNEVKYLSELEAVNRRRPPAVHPYAEPHRAGAQVATDRQVANRAPDLSGTPEKKGVRSCENHDVRPTVVQS